MESITADQWDQFQIEEIETRLSTLFKVGDSLLECFCGVCNYPQHVIDSMYKLNKYSFLPQVKVVFVEPYKCMMVARKWYHTTLYTSLHQLTDQQIDDISSQVEIIKRELLADDIHLHGVRLADILLDDNLIVSLNGIQTRVQRISAEFTLRTKVWFEPYSDYIDLEEVDLRQYLHILRKVQLESSTRN